MTMTINQLLFHPVWASDHFEFCNITCYTLCYLLSDLSCLKFKLREELWRQIQIIIKSTEQRRHSGVGVAEGEGDAGGAGGDPAPPLLLRAHHRQQVRDPSPGN